MIPLASKLLPPTIKMASRTVPALGRVTVSEPPVWRTMLPMESVAEPVVPAAVIARDDPSPFPMVNCEMLPE